MILVYGTSLHFGFVTFDDSTLIEYRKAFNERWSSFGQAFGTSVFGMGDVYYRPLLVVSFLINFKMGSADPLGYHIANVVLHLANVLLLFTLLRKLVPKQWIAFFLALIFAVHPVLSQAVAWIPGRNDSLLGLFCWPFFMASINYTNGQKRGWLWLSVVCLAGAFLTKETAIVIPVVDFALLLLVYKKSWRAPRMWIQYACWTFVVIGWFWMRQQAVGENLAVNTTPTPGVISHIPLPLQYLGKIFLPVNLNGFPTIEDTSNVYGLVAFALLVLLLFLRKKKDWRIIAWGGFTFIIFLLPLILVPKEDMGKVMALEHRLYLPFAGLLILLSETVIFHNKLSEKNNATLLSILCIALGVTNIIHQQTFANPVTFWKDAVARSPHSGFAAMKYWAALTDKQEKVAALRNAYLVDSSEENIRFYYGVMLLDEDSIDQAIPYFLREQEMTDYAECDFYLAKICYRRHDAAGAIAHMERFLSKDSLSKEGNRNLLMIYVTTHQNEKAKEQARKMTLRNLPLSEDVQRHIDSL